MRLTKILVATALPLALSLACGGSASDSGDGDGDGPADPSSSDGKEDVCETFCEEIEACEGIDVEDCVDSCTENETTSVAGQEVINDCFDADLCEAASDEALGLGLICLITGASDLDLSEEAQTYCDESVDIINACLESEPAADAGIGNCDDTIGIASDELLADLNACAERPCDEVESCVMVTALSSLPLDALLLLEDGGEPSPSLVAELLAVAVVFGQLGLEDSTGDLFGDMADPPPSALGGRAGQ